MKYLHGLLFKITSITCNIVMSCQLKIPLKQLLRDISNDTAEKTMFQVSIYFRKVLRMFLSNSDIVYACHAVFIMIFRLWETHDTCRSGKIVSFMSLYEAFSSWYHFHTCTEFLYLSCQTCRFYSFILIKH